MTEPRLAPIEAPKGLMMKLAYAMSRRMLGKVMTPMKVAYARVPALSRLSYSMSRVMQRDLSLDPELRLLLTAQASALNGCGFCLDMAQAMAVDSGVGLEKLQRLAEYETDPIFDARERAALDYVSEATRRCQVSDDTFARLQRHFDDREIVEITFVNAAENFYNLFGGPLRIESDGLCAIALERKGESPALEPVRGEEVATTSH